MTLFEKDLKKLLDRVRIPEPGDEARATALRAAAAEFDRLKQAQEKIDKGFTRDERLTDKPIKGGSVMRKPLVISAGLAAGLAALIMAVILPNFLSYRTRGSAPTTALQDFRVQKSYETVPQAPPAQVPAPRPEKILAARPQKKHDIKAEQRAGQVQPMMQEFAAKFSASEPKMMLAEPRMEMYDSSAEQNAGQGLPLTQEYVGRDQFETIVSNPVKRAAEEPVSTFSIDVDTASYAFVRRALNSGVLPQKNAVRIEELINYFDYDYPLPVDRKAPFKPMIAVFPTPWNPATKLLHIGIKGLDIVAENKPAANLVFLIDVSGSMSSPDKLPLLQNALRMLVETLEPEDTVAIVVYAGKAGTVLEPTRVKDKAKIIEALDRLTAGGSTAGGEGIRRAYDLAEANFNAKGVNRIILATDGDFNVGIRNPEELKGFVERKRKTGIFLSVLGFGQGNYNDALMQKLAQNGNGNAAYIDTLNEARKVLVEEAGATLFTIAKDVKIQVEFNPAKVAEYRLIGYETRLLQREDFNNDQVDAGDVGAGHSVTAIYEITPFGSSARLIDELRYTGTERAEKAADSGNSDEYAFLKIRYKLPDAETSELMTTPIDRSLEYGLIEKVPGEAVFAAAVAAFGQILRGEPYTKAFTYDDVLALAEPVRGKDRFGYRSEFLNLVRLAKTARIIGDR